MPTIQQEILDKENIVSYASAIYKATVILIQKYKEGYDCLVNPSRGANPIVHGMIDAIEYFANNDKDARELAEAYRSRKFPIIPVPLTADIAIPEEDLAQYGMTKEDIDSAVDNMRFYGAEIVKSLSYSQDKRKEDRNFIILDWIFSEIERRDDTSKFYMELSPIKKPVFIDTAISGRASTTILNAFNEIGFFPYSLIFLDKNGEKLKQVFKKDLDNYKNHGNLETIKMKRILTEDREAVLLGVYAAFYPQVLLELRKKLIRIEKNDSPHISAVTWYDINDSRHAVPLKLYKETFGILMKTLKDTVVGISSIIGVPSTDNGLNGYSELDPKDILDLLPKEALNEMDENLHNLTENIEKSAMLHLEESPKKLFDVQIRKYLETRSHVFHLWLPEKTLKEKLKKLEGKLFN